MRTTSLYHPQTHSTHFLTYHTHITLIERLYKLNHSKSSMLGIGLSSELKSHTSCTAPFSWAPTDSLTYLGIQLVTSSTNVLHINIDMLTKKFQTITESLPPVQTFSAGKIVLTKLFLLPHIFYLFRTLPASILPTCLTKKFLHLGPQENHA